MKFNKIVEFILSNRALKHFLFWFFYGLFSITNVGVMEEKNFMLEFIFFACLLPVKMLFTYVVIYYLFPKYLLTGRIAGFLIGIIVLLPIAVFSQRAMANFVVYPIFAPEYTAKGFLCDHCLVYGLVGFIILFGYAVALNLFKHWYINRQNEQKLVKEKLEAELKFLKAQIHPHFLFNTLNNLYALALKKSDKAAEMVLKLSDLLNYMLYECNADTVELQKEIDLVTNYIALERLRYGNDLRVNFTLNCNATGVAVAPMLILPLVENAFKHGLSQQPKSGFITIIIDCENTDLLIKVENSKPEGVYKNKTTESYKEGIGLQNLKRRLQLLYKGKHSVTVNETENIFTVEVIISDLK